MKREAERRAGDIGEERSGRVRAEFRLIHPVYHSLLLVLVRLYRCWISESALAI